MYIMRWCHDSRHSRNLLLGSKLTKNDRTVNERGNLTTIYKSFTTKTAV
jgi:hypothetical protein